MSSSRTAPQPITLYPLPRNLTQIQLTKNVVETQETHEEETYTLYTYEEVIFNVRTKDNLQEEVESNFDLYWQFGETQIAKEHAERENATRMAELIKQMKLTGELDGIITALMEQEFDITLLQLEV